MPRHTRIYTRTGDRGDTGLAGGQRVSKDSPRIWAYGTVDELNACIGLARAFNAEEAAASSGKIDELLSDVQNDLFSLGTELAALPEDFRGAMPRIEQAHVQKLEKLMDVLEADLEPLKEFILPAGCKTATALHQARTICRRAERFCVRLARDEKIGEFVVPYLNRLSDLLFVLARWANKMRGMKESFWKK